MQEKNRHIIQNAISSLPVHKAPAMAWDNIETMMLAVPADVLPVHEAPAALWSSIQSGIAKPGFFTSRMNRMIFISLFVVLLSGAGIVYFSGNGSVPNNPETEKISILPLVEDERINVGMKDEGVEMKDEGLLMKDDALRLCSGIEVEEETRAIATDKIVEINSYVNEGLSDISEGKSENAYPGISLLRLNPPTLKLLGGMDENHNKPGLFGSNIGDGDITISGNPYRDCNFNAAVYDYRIGLNMEYMHFLNSFEPDNAKMKYWISAGLGAIFKRNRLAIETGLGLSYSKDKIDYSYDYLTQELVDSYEYVDSVHVDPVTGQVQYFTTTVEVYDSVPYSKQTSLEKKYTYLQIPLLVGYDVAKYHNFIFTVKAGFTYFMQIKMKEKYPELYHENSRIKNYQANDVSRKKDFLKMSAGICVRWHFDRRFNITVSPTFHYFFSNIYENINNKNPISIGFRIGLYYKL